MPTKIRQTFDNGGTGYQYVTIVTYKAHWDKTNLGCPPSGRGWLFCLAALVLLLPNTLKCEGHTEKKWLAVNSIDQKKKKNIFLQNNHGQIYECCWCLE
jgi:hypothetical protein